jgi:hypothetical protein
VGRPGHRVGPRHHCQRGRALYLQRHTWPAQGGLPDTPPLHAASSSFNAGVLPAGFLAPSSPALLPLPIIPLPFHQCTQSCNTLSLRLLAWQFLNDFSFFIFRGFFIWFWVKLYVLYHMSVGRAVWGGLGIFRGV